MELSVSAVQEEKFSTKRETFVNVQKILVGMVMVAQPYSNVKMVKNGMFLNLCASALIQVCGMELTV